MQVVERKVSAGNRDIFDLEEFLARPLLHTWPIALNRAPVSHRFGFHWDGTSLWIISSGPNTVQPSGAGADDAK
jgi:hypothetical protein